MKNPYKTGIKFTWGVITAIGQLIVLSWVFGWIKGLFA